MTQTINHPTTPGWQAPPPPPATAKTKRAWKTWQLATGVLMALMLGVGMGGSGGGDAAKVKDAQAELASAKAQATADVAAADKRAADAVNLAKVEVEKDAAARTAALDKRSAELDTRSAGLDKREATVDAKEAAKKASTFEDGTHQVGADIIPGTYHTDGGSGCYWEKSTGGTGINSIIDNDNVDGPVTLIIEASTKFFKSSGCGTWIKR
jgi:hypothetical protein